MKVKVIAAERPKFKNAFNANKFPKRYEVNNMPSETVPDQSMTITEIITRFAKGLPLGGQRVEQFLGVDDVLEGVNWNTLDLAEQHEFIADRQRELQILRMKQRDRDKVRQDMEVMAKAKDQVKQEMENDKTPGQQQSSSSGDKIS